MKCLVTGATGHIGSALVRRLLEDGQEVIAFVLPGDSLEALAGLDVQVIYGDVTHYEELQNAVMQVDQVFHLAAVVDIGSCKKRKLYRVNVEGVKNVVKACLCSGYVPLVYVSSVHAIQEPPHGEIISETGTFNPKKVHGAYGKSKAMATSIVLDACQRGLNAKIVHPSGVIGPYEYKVSNLGQLVLDFVHGNLKAYINGMYNFVDVRDVAEGIVQAAKKGQSGECYILSGEQVSVAQLLDYLEEITQVAKPKVRLPYFLAKITAPFAELYYKARKQPPLFTSYAVSTLKSNCNFSNQKAQKQLGYSPRPVRDSLRDTFQWFRKR